MKIERVYTLLLLVPSLHYFFVPKHRIRSDSDWTDGISTPLCCRSTLPLLDTNTTYKMSDFAKNRMVTELIFAVQRRYL